MTIQATPRKAGPFLGDGVTTEFPFAFKVFDRTHLQVILTEDGKDHTLVLNSDYSVNLNADQEANPGGVVTLAEALRASAKLTIVTREPAEQLTVLNNMGGFQPKTIERQLDYQTMLLQKHERLLEQAVLVGVTQEPPDVSVVEGYAESAASSAESAASSAGDAAVLASMAQEALSAFQLARLDTYTFTAQGGETVLQGTDDNDNLLAYTPGLIQVYREGVRLVPGEDYTAADGHSIAGITPPLVTGEVVVVDVFSRFALAEVTPVLGSKVTARVPSQFPTLQAAIDAYSANPARANTQIEVLIESGHRLTAGLRLVGGDYSHFIIKSEDPVVYLASGFVPVDSSPVPESSRAIFYFESCIAPVLGCLIDGEGVSSHDGLIAYRNAHVNVAPGAGVMGTRMNCEVRNGRIHAKNTVWSRARRGCMRLTDNTQFTISGSEFSDSWTHPPSGTSPTSAAVHISRSSIGQAQSLLIERSGLAAITVRRSRVYLDGTTINVTGLAGIGSSTIPIRPQEGATIVLGDVVFNGNPITPAQCQVEAFNVPHARGIVYASGHPATLHSIVRTGSENAVSFSRALRVKQILLPDFSLNGPDVTLSLDGEFAADSFTAAFVSVAGAAWMAGTGFTARLRAVNALVVGAIGNSVRIRMHDPENNATDQTVDLLVTVIGRPAEDS